MPGAYLEDDHGNYTEPVSSVSSPTLTVSHPLQNDQIMDLDYVGTRDVVFTSQSDTKGTHGIHSEPVSLICHTTSHLKPSQDGDQIMDLAGVATNSLAGGSETVGAFETHAITAHWFRLAGPGSQ